MFKNIIHQVFIDDILIDRSTRQRTDLTFDSVLPLALSIGKSQWISPILIDEETNYIVAGERRLTAVKLLRAACAGDYSVFTNPQAARELLFPVCTCQVDSWDRWNKIPAQLGSKLTPADLAMYEFIENAHREDLSWQDRARAIYNIHTTELLKSKNWTAVQTASLININRAVVQENLRVWRVYADEDASDDIKKIIQESPTLKSAAQVIERYTSRRGEDVNLLSGGIAVTRIKAEKPLYKKPGPQPLTNVNKPKEDTNDWDYEWNINCPLADQILINKDFTTWAESYTGEPFNFIHCDFPYGINFNTGPETSRVENKIIGNYNDSSDIYWALLNTLKTNKHLIAPQAHIMFWFSQNLRRETEDFFTSIGGFVQPFLMVWHCNNEGVLPDPQRYGRRTYETAMLITFGDRKIVVPRALSIDSSREKESRVHRSQKPLKILRHFFEMFVDNSSRVLDPTCGSGTSLIIAHQLGAKDILGLEVDMDIYKNAYDYINAVHENMMRSITHEKR